FPRSSNPPAARRSAIFCALARAQFSASSRPVNDQPVAVIPSNFARTQNGGIFMRMRVPALGHDQERLARATDRRRNVFLPTHDYSRAGPPKALFAAGVTFSQIDRSVSR